MQRKNNTLFKNLVFVFGITFFAKITGFIREMVYGSQLGITAISDNFVMAQTIPVTLYAILTQAFRTTFIPNLFKIKREEGDKAVESYTGNYIFAVTAASVVIFFLLFIFARPLTLVFAGGFSEENIAQTVYLIRYISITVLFGGLIDVLNGYLQSVGHYNIGASLNIFSNTVFCGFLFLYHVWGIKAILLGCVVSKAVELLIVIAAAVFYKLKVRFKSRKYLRYTLDALKNSVPVLLGSVITDLGNLIDKRFATMLMFGTVSALNYANKVQIMIVQLFSATIGAVLFPELSKLSYDIPHFKHMVEKGMKYIFIIMVPISIGTISVSENFVSVLFQRGAFGNDAVTLTSQCLMFYAPAILFTVCYEFVSKACFALHDTKTPILMSAIGMIVNVGFNALLIHRFQHQGLAFATSLSMIISFIGVYYILQKRLVLNSKSLLLTAIKVLIAGMTMFFAIILLHEMTYSNKYISFVVYVAVGAIIYYLSLVALRCSEAKELVGMFTRKIRRKTN